MSTAMTMPVGSAYWATRPREVARAGTDIGDCDTLANLERFHQFVGPLFGIAFGPVAERHVLRSRQNISGSLRGWLSRIVRSVRI